MCDFTHVIKSSEPTTVPNSAPQKIIKIPLYKSKLLSVNIYLFLPI